MAIFAEIGQMHSLIAAMAILLGLLFSVIIFMLSYLVVRKKRNFQSATWKKKADHLIWSVIFFEQGPDPGETPPLPSNIGRWMKNALFRQCLIDELINAKKNLAGSAGKNLIKLYNKLGLEKDSERKLSSLKWHIKARGIQELTAMDRKDKVRKIYRHTNNRNEFIRMEAQLGIVQLYGWEGLRFLDVVSYPITEWQQIKLLAQLHGDDGSGLAPMDRWLLSPNASVIAVTLKLAGTHRRFDLHDQVSLCLLHADPSIRVLTVKCLEHIYNESTADLIADRYQSNGKKYRYAALETIGSIGSPDKIPFLQMALSNEDDHLKLGAARALRRLGAEGLHALGSFERKDEYPWNEIIQQAKTEPIP